MKSSPPDRFTYKSIYRRNLPHIQPVNSTLFLTFRLAGSLPQSVLARMAAERRLIRSRMEARKMFESDLAELTRRHFATLEASLHEASVGPTWLAEERVAALVAGAMRYRNGSQYRLDCYSIMPNHVHAVFAPAISKNSPKSLSSIMHSLKRNTAKQANRILGRSGAFWEHESFDHYIRNHAEWKRIVKYVLENP
jgi:putative transposase